MKGNSRMRGGKKRGNPGYRTPAVFRYQKSLKVKQQKYYQLPT